MADQDVSPATTADSVPLSAADELSGELASSLASVWARFAGARPVDTAVEFDGRVVRWSLPDGLDALNAGIETSGEDDGTQLTMTSYHRATCSAVSKTTHRRVSAHMSKQDKTTGAATETFILEALTKKY